jgi:hypothetical protein
MIQKVLSHMGGVGVYGLISLGLFLAVFIGVLIWAFGLKPSYLKSMQELPLEDDSDVAGRVETFNQDARHE